MIVGVNLIPYTASSGIEVFAGNILASLAKLNQKHQLILFTNQASAKLFANDFKTPQSLGYEETAARRVVILPRRNLSTLNLLWYQQWGLPRQLRRYKIDLLFCPSMSMPLLWRKKIVTIHDLSWKREVGESSWLGRLYLNLALWFVKHNARQILTVSDFAAGELMAGAKIAKNKITVLKLAAPALSRPADWPTVMAKYRLSRPYFFCIGNVRPRKNLERTIESFAQFNQARKYYLVIAGKGDTKNLHQLAANLSQADFVKFIGPVDEAEKVGLYEHALALVFCSLYEGFGLPVLEAQTLGVPVLTSRTSSLPEVAGSGAILVDPQSVDEIAAGLAKLVDDDELRQQIIAAGYHNLHRFSWEETAAKLLKFFDDYEASSSK